MNIHGQTIDLGKLISSSKDRSYFLKGFNSILENKLQEYDVNCTLKSKANWFKKGKKKTVPFWR